MELLKTDAAKDLEPPMCYIPIWVPVESPSEKIQRAKEELAATAIIEPVVEVSNDPKDTDSNGKKEADNAEATITSGLSPTTTVTKSPKPQRERKKSKSKNEEEKSADEKIETPKTPPKADSTKDTKSPMKKSPEESSKSPKKSVGDEEQNIVQN